MLKFVQKLTFCHSLPSETTTKSLLKHLVSNCYHYIPYVWHFKPLPRFLVRKAPTQQQQHSSSPVIKESKLTIINVTFGTAMNKKCCKVLSKANNYGRQWNSSWTRQPFSFDDLLFKTGLQRNIHTKARTSALHCCLWLTVCPNEEYLLFTPGQQQKVVLLILFTQCSRVIT